MCLFPFVYVCINGCSFDVKLSFAGPSVGGGLTCASLLPLVRHTRTLMLCVQYFLHAHLGGDTLLGARTLIASTPPGLLHLLLSRQILDCFAQSCPYAGMVRITVFNPGVMWGCPVYLLMLLIPQNVALAANTFSSPSQCSATGYTRGHCLRAVLTFVPVSF